MTDVPQVGTPIINREQIDALPVGSMIRVRTNHAETYTKIAASGHYQWTSVSGDNYPQESFSLASYNEVGRVGPEDPSLAGTETLVGVKTKFRDAALRAQSRHGVDLQPILDAFAELGISEETVVVGAEVDAGQRVDLRLPMGTLMQRGDPAEPSTYGLFEKRPGGWHPLMGDVTRLRGTAVIIRVGNDLYETPNWMNEDTSDPEAIRKWRAEAYAVAKKVKTRTRWCEVLEQTIAVAGVTASVLALDGQRVDRYGCRRLPAGSVLRWQHRSNPDEFMFWVRDDAATNTARVRLSFANRPSGVHPSTSGMAAMVVAYEASQGDFSIPIPNAHLRYLPPGATFAQTDRVSRDQYRVHHDGSFSYVPDGYPTEGHGNYNLSSFTAENIFVTSLP